MDFGLRAVDDKPYLKVVEKADTGDISAFIEEQPERVDFSDVVGLEDVKKQIETVFGAKVFKTAISKSVRLEESPAYKQSIFAFAPQSSGAAEYYSLSEEVIARV